MVEFGTTTPVFGSTQLLQQLLLNAMVLHDPGRSSTEVVYAPIISKGVPEGLTFQAGQPYCRRIRLQQHPSVALIVIP